MDNKPKGIKLDQNKPKLHMLPKEALYAAAYAFMHGEKKYSRFNYKNGLEFSRLADSLMRHLLAWMDGEENDPESGLPHTYHINANAMMLEYTRVHHPELDDRFKLNEEKIT